MLNRKNLLKRNTVLFLLVLFVFTLGISSMAYAKTRKTKKSIKAGASFTIKIKKAGTWKASNSKVVSIEVSPDGKRCKVTGMKKGKSKVTAKSGKQKYICTVTVKKGSSKAPNPVIATIKELPLSGSDTRYIIDTGAEADGYMEASIEGSINTELNSYRQRSGLNALEIDPVLSNLARIRAVEASILTSHIRPNGMQFYTVYGTPSMDYKDTIARGENLAYGITYAPDLISQWDASPSHHENLVRAFNKVGTGVFMRNVSGIYVAYVCQLYGF